jgi:hypothetical protein
MLQKWPAGLAPDADVTFYLVHERGFSEDAAKGVLANFKASFQCAGVDVSDSVADNGRGDSTGQDGNVTPKKPNIPPPPSVRIMEGERVVFTHEIEPAHLVRILVSGKVDDSVLNALELYIQLHKQLEQERKAAKQTE